MAAELQAPLLHQDRLHALSSQLRKDGRMARGPAFGEKRLVVQLSSF